MKEILSIAQKQISRGNTEYALEALLSISENFDRNTADNLTQLSGQFFKTKRNAQLGLGYDKQDEARVNNAILSIINELNDNSFNYTKNSSSLKTEKWFCLWELGTKIYEEVLEINISDLGDINGKRYLIFKDITDEFSVSGIKRRSDYMFAYFKEFDKTGGGVVILQEFVAGRLRGTLTYQNCDAGDVKCYKNEWIEYQNRFYYQRGKQNLIGETETNF